ncbi:MAG TPA: carboxypeptidase-like regulatory domain-containing protein, partial [Fibrella sp.]
MTLLFEYWLKANLFLLLFYGCYALLLRRHTFLSLNRTYLMGSLAMALLLPLVHIPGLSFPWPWETDVPVYATVSADTITVVGMAAEAQSPLLPDWPVLAAWAFALVAAGLLLRTGWRTYALLRLIRQWPAQPFSDHTLVLPDTAQTPTFSFFRYLVLNPDDAQTEAVRQHELVHIRQKHSLDVLLLEVVQALCWPNPALFGYRQAIRQVHEYLADRDATRQTPTHRDAYARFLVSYAFHLPAGTVMTDQLGHDSLAHSFGPDRPDSPTLKQRIQMLYQQHTRRRALWKYALVLPLATALLAMTNEPESAPESESESTTNSGTLAGQTTYSNSSVRMIHVQGYVRDRRGKYPASNLLVGANIVVRNGHKGTTTDAKGLFSIDVPAGTELVASSVGFESQTIVVPGKGGNVVIVFSLQPLAVDGVSMPV